jgi:uncharacterized protein
VLPRNQRAGAAWNYEHGGDAEGSRVCLHYLINRLQPLPCKQPIVVSLNPVSAIQPDKIIRRIAYTHPVFDSAAIQAQNELHRIQGTQNTWFCGAWAGYGFHEDGLKAGTAIAQALVEIIEGKRDSSSRPRMPLNIPSLPSSSDLASTVIHA